MVVAATSTAYAVALGGAFWWPRRPALLAAGAVVAAVVSLLHTITYRGPGDNVVAGWVLVETLAQLWVVVQAVRRPPVWAAATAGSLLVVAVGVSPLRIGLWLTPPAPAVEVVLVCVCLALPAVIAAGVGVYLRRLDAERARSVAAARRDQRVQLARDLHDWLAHEMTGIVLTAQAGGLDARDPVEAARAFHQIEEAGVRGLAAMDRALRLLSVADDGAETTDRQPTLADVVEVADRFSLTGPVTVDVAIDDTLDDLRPEVLATVHRVVVESLTNVRRHATTATDVRIEVAREGPGLRVLVRDNGGKPAHRFGRRGGSGLVGLGARVEALGGTLTAGPAAAGWAVLAQVPA
jgi:signal transduction histidine kinase